ncbi:hypothetical protein PLESTB_000558000 [Pleodorina starrii]|uniref:Uncharacterized protein n=1 Tax=Pleodorina starrii TaxID=330485 RepID=A0A9W6BHG4_9CHLO|nr:hypothetical protein PLESTB_000558000 [Pleodorina starrii]
MAPAYLLWIWQLLRVPENEVVSVAGLDSAVYLRTLRMAWSILAWISVWCLAVVLPVNISGHQVDVLLSAPPAPEAKINILGHSSSVYDVSYFDRCSMSNIPSRSNKLFVHVFSAYVVTAIVLTILWRYNKEMTVLRILFLASAPKGGPSHTVLVQDIPGTKYGTVPWALKKLLSTTLLRFLPRSWRETLEELAEDFFFGGLARVWAKARAKAGALRAGARSRRATQRAMSRWARTATTTTTTSGGGGGGGSGGGAASASAAGDGSCANYFADYRQHAKEADEAEGEAGLPTDVLAFAERLNLELEAPVERLKVDVRTARGRLLDVWDMAAHFLEQRPAPGQEPPSLASMVEAEFRYVYGNEVAVVNPVWDQRELDPLLAEYGKIRTRLEDYLDWATTRMRRRKPLRPYMIRVIPMAHPGWGWGSQLFGVRPVRVEALVFWSERLRALVGQIGEAQARTRGLQATPAAFVTFSSRKAQVIAASSLHQHVEFLWRVQPAPDAAEVLWANLRMRSWERMLRQLASWSMFFGLLCCYFVPVAAIQVGRAAA